MTTVTRMAALRFQNNDSYEDGDLLSMGAGRGGKGVPANQEPGSSMQQLQAGLAKESFKGLHPGESTLTKQRGNRTWLGRSIAEREGGLSEKGVVIWNHKVS